MCEKRNMEGFLRNGQVKINRNSVESVGRTFEKSPLSQILGDLPRVGVHGKGSSTTLRHSVHRGMAHLLLRFAGLRTAGHFALGHVAGETTDVVL
jgi:hypothetical protein